MNLIAVYYVCNYNVYRFKKQQNYTKRSRDAFVKIQKSSSDNQMVRNIVRVKIKALISLRNYCFY